MVPLKEDGSLEIERINSLPLEDYMDMMSNLTDEQLTEYRSKLPIKEARNSVTSIKVDFGFDDDDPRSGVDMEEYLVKKKKKYGII